MSNWVIYKREGSIHSYVFENENASEMRAQGPGRTDREGGILGGNMRSTFFPSYQKASRASPLGFPGSLPMGLGKL